MVKQVNTDSMIKAHSFAKVVGNSLEDDDLFAGDYVYVGAIQALPCDENDLYMQRLHILGHKYLGDGKVDASSMLMIDPKYLIKASAGADKRMAKALVKRYAKNESTN